MRIASFLKSGRRGGDLAVDDRCAYGLAGLSRACPSGRVYCCVSHDVRDGNGESAPGARVPESGGWVGLFGLDEFDCAEPFEWPVNEEDLEREVGVDVGL